MLNYTVQVNIPFGKATRELIDQLYSYTLINQRGYSAETVERLWKLRLQLEDLQKEVLAVDNLFAGFISEEEFLKNEPR